METEKKPKSGFARLKVKYEKLDAEKKELQAKLVNAEAERDSWHGKYTNEHGYHVEAAEKHRDAVERLEFVLNHCGPITRWRYRKQFGK